MFQVQLSLGPKKVRLNLEDKLVFTVTGGSSRGAFSLVLLHGLLSGPGVGDRALHGAVCGSFGGAAGGSEGRVLSGSSLRALFYATAACVAATAAAHWVTRAFLAVPACLGALQDVRRCLLLCLVHVTALILGAARHLSLGLLGTRTHFGVSAACWFWKRTE